MPKYYRFRATTPTRKPKRSKDKEKERELEKTKFEAERSWLDLTLACTPAPSWYLRRTSWRESPPLMGLPRQLAAGLRASLQLSTKLRTYFQVTREPGLRARSSTHTYGPGSKQELNWGSF
ncbi:uncharacterized protein LOC111353933 isoform X1 [Spodoptera litura]|uniref:Uncharacterized protein LOC111353933 isoform X1 n=1 Tax=Spodoptera litura TaxID=69820 RepID=A0A9J7E6Q0_SPOLT|nr:uncharacterized protein LOC111353933 isoform X1 [Spodoptera litura]